ncbi:MAG TPA: DUF2264 domain-containing protein [Rariglobus sp.]|nr:DUF2264 domain-containing protein [Rariglobus sp.]
MFPPIITPQIQDEAFSLTSREDWLQTAQRLCRAAFDHRSSEGTSLELGRTSSTFDPCAQDMESFARPLWAWIPLTASTGTNEEWPEILRGLTNALNPDHPQAWGEQEDIDQRSVETTVLATGLCLVPESLWTPLSAAEQTRLARWLYQINQVNLPANNWRWFRVLVNLGLRSVGQPWDQAVMERDLVVLDSLYLDDGWSMDGPRGNRGDYYNGMALQSYALIYSKLAADLDPARAAVFRERAVRFARQFLHWFSADGTAVPFGRSLIYRFAQGSFWSALVFADVEALPWGVIKGLLARHVREWLRQPILDASGCLTIGYGYPNLNVSEGYNSPGSPYWALKAFLHLAVSADHPFWNCEERPMPARAPVSVQPHAGKVLFHGPGAQDVTALNEGDATRHVHWLRHRAAKYQKFAYSGASAFCVPVSGEHYEQGGWDQMLAFSRDGIHFSGRECNLRSHLAADGVLWAEWSPMPGVTVQTWTRVWECWQVRVHCIASEIPCETVEAGGALPWAGRNSWLPPERPDAVELVSSGYFGAIHGLFGTRTARVHSLEPNCNLRHPRVCLPTLSTALTPGVTWLAAAMLTSASAERAAAYRTLPQRWTASMDPVGGSLRIQAESEPWICIPK